MKNLILFNSEMIQSSVETSKIYRSFEQPARDLDAALEDKDSLDEETDFHKPKAVENAVSEAYNRLINSQVLKDHPKHKQQVDSNIQSKLSAALVAYSSAITKSNETQEATFQSLQERFLKGLEKFRTDTQALLDTRLRVRGKEKVKERNKIDLQLSQIDHLLEHYKKEKQESETMLKDEGLLELSFGKIRKSQEKMLESIRTHINNKFLVLLRTLRDAPELKARFEDQVKALQEKRNNLFSGKLEGATGWESTKNSVDISDMTFEEFLKKESRFEKTLMNYGVGVVGGVWDGFWFIVDPRNWPGIVKGIGTAIGNTAGFISLSQPQKDKVMHDLGVELVKEGDAFTSLSPEEQTKKIGHILGMLIGMGGGAKVVGKIGRAGMDKISAGKKAPVSAETSTKPKPKTDKTTPSQKKPKNKKIKNKSQAMSKTKQKKNDAPSKAETKTKINRKTLSLDELSIYASNLKELMSFERILSNAKNLSKERRIKVESRISGLKKAIESFEKRGARAQLKARNDLEAAAKAEPKPKSKEPKKSTTKTKETAVSSEVRSKLPAKSKPPKSTKPSQITKQRPAVSAKPKPRTKTTEKPAQLPAIARSEKLTKKLNLPTPKNLPAGVLDFAKARAKLKKAKKPLLIEARGFKKAIKTRFPKLPLAAAAAALVAYAAEKYSDDEVEAIIPEVFADEPKPSAVEAPPQSTPPVPAPTPVVPEAKPEAPKLNYNIKFVGLLDRSTNYSKVMNKNADIIFDKLSEENNNIMRELAISIEKDSKGGRNRHGKPTGRAWIVALQKKLNTEPDIDLRADGLAGGKTIAALEKYLEKKHKESTSA